MTIISGANRLAFSTKLRPPLQSKIQQEIAFSKPIIIIKHTLASRQYRGMDLYYHLTDFPPKSMIQTYLTDFSIAYTHLFHKTNIRHSNKVDI